MRKFPSWIGPLFFSFGFLFVGCSSETVPANDWMTSVCTGLTTYAGELKDVPIAVQTATSPETTPEEGKDLLIEAYTTMANATDKLIERVRRAGIPDLENGEQISEGVISGMQQVKQALDRVLQKVPHLPTDPERFLVEIEKLATDLQRELQSIGGALEVGDLPEQAQNVEACRAFRTS